MRYSARSHWNIRSAIGVLLFLITGAVSYGADRSYEEGLIARVTATFSDGSGLAAGADPEGLHVIKCGTPLVYEIRMNWPNLSESARQKIAGLVDFYRPALDESYDFDTQYGGVRIHYSRTGTDAVNMSFGVDSTSNVPKYVLRCAALMDTVVQAEITALGYRFPVSDQEGRPGEDPRFDIYLVNLRNRYPLVEVYGMTIPDTLVFKPDRNIFWLTSWMEISSDYTRLTAYRDRPFEAMAVTLAHEFFHSIQWTYDAEEAEFRNNALNSWFNELSSTWMEDVVFDRVNDYRSYLEYFLHYPWLSLRVFRGLNPEQQHPYASCLLGKFLTERYDANVMRDIWERCGAQARFNTFDAFDWALNKRGTSFASAWAEFLVWNYFTGGRSRSWSYKEGADFPLHRPGLRDFDGQISDSLIKHHSDYPAEGSTSPDRPAYNSDELAGSYISFFPPPSDTAVDFHFQVTPDNFDSGMIVMAGIHPTGKPDIIYAIDMFNPATLQDWTRYDEVLVIVSPFKSRPSQEVLTRNLSFHYAVQDTFESQKGISTKVYSNPLLLKGSGEADTFRVDVSLDQPHEVSMYVYTTDGILVRGAPDRDMIFAAGRRRVSLLWDGTNRDQKTVASGIYLALVQIGDKREIIKVAVRNEK